MCAYGTLLHPTCGTWPIMCHVYLWGLSPSPSNLWDPMACVSLVLVDPSPSNLWDKNDTFLHLHLTYGTRRHLYPSPSDMWGPDGLRDTCTCGTIQHLGPGDLCVTCICGTFLYLHPTYRSWQLACHLLPPGFNKFKLKKIHETWESNPGPRARNRPSSPLR
jgi:hypothetical protein